MSPLAKKPAKLKFLLDENVDVLSKLLTEVSSQEFSGKVFLLSEAGVEIKE